MAPQKSFVTKDSSISGKGAFATRHIAKGEVITHLVGEVVSEKEIDKRIAEGKETRDDPLQIGYGVYIDLDEESRQINHSCDPNAGVRGTNELFAIRDIAPEEEITFDYATVVGENSDWMMRCKCGAKNCRGKIKNYTSIPKDRLQRYYVLGCLPDFIKETVTI